MQILILPRVKCGNIAVFMCRGPASYEYKNAWSINIKVHGSIHDYKGSRNTAAMDRAGAVTVDLF